MTECVTVTVVTIKKLRLDIWGLERETSFLDKQHVVSRTEIQRSEVRGWYWFQRQKSEQKNGPKNGPLTNLIVWVNSNHESS